MNLARLRRATAPVAVLLTIAALLALSLIEETAPAASPQIGKPAPQFSLPRLDGTGLAASAAYANRPWVLNVWATWCVPCRVEHKYLMQLAAAGGAIVGINYRDENAAASAWLAERGNPYEMIGVDPEGRMASDWGILGVPETYVVSAEGIIVHKVAGPIDSESKLRTIADML